MLFTATQTFFLMSVSQMFVWVTHFGSETFQL